MNSLYKIINQVTYLTTQRDRHIYPIDRETKCWHKTQKTPTEMVKIEMGTRYNKAIGP